MSTRTSLGDKWVLANGADDPRYTEGSGDIQTVAASDSNTPVLITDEAAWSDDGLPREMLIPSNSSHHFTNIFYMGNNEYWRLLGYCDDNNDQYIEVHKYNYNTKEYTVDAINVYENIGLSYVFESLCGNDYIGTIGEGYYHSDIVATADFGGFAIYGEYDHLKELIVISRDMKLAHKYIIYSDDSGEDSIFAEDEFRDGIQEFNIFGGPDVDHIYWRMLLKPSDDSDDDGYSDQYSVIYKNNEMAMQLIYNSHTITRARSFNINNSIYLLIDTDEGLTALYQLNETGMEYIGQFEDSDGNNYELIAQLSFPFEDYIIMPMSGIAMYYNTKNGDTSYGASGDYSYPYDGTNLLPGLGFSGIIYNAINADVEFDILYTDNIDTYINEGDFTAVTSTPADTAPGLYIGNIINARDEINTTGIILTDYIPEGATHAMCARSTPDVPKLPNISVENCYVFIKIKE